MKLKNILGFLYAIYLIMSQIMTVVFFIQYCRTDSLLEIIFIDLKSATIIQYTIKGRFMSR